MRTRAVCIHTMIAMAACSSGAGGSGDGGASSPDLASSGGGTLTATFSNASGTNAETTTFVATQTSGIFLAGLEFTMKWTAPGASSTREFDFASDQSSTKPTAGTVFNLSLPKKPSGGTYVEYSEQPGSPGQPPRTWFTTGGTLTIVSLSSSSATVSVQGATFAAGADGNMAGTGTFTVAVTGDCQNVQQ